MVSFKGEADGKVGQLQLIADFKIPVIILKIREKLGKHKKEFWSLITLWQATRSESVTRIA